jgi:hypothetical protein
MRAISAPVEAEKADRSAGFLTETERKYLLGEWGPGDNDAGEWSEQQERSKRSDIKTRTRHAIADVALLEKHGDDELIRNVIEREQAPDDNVPTFYPDTLNSAKEGLSSFMIRIALNADRADEVIDYLQSENFEEVFEEMDQAVEESKQIADEHEHFLKPATNKLQEYAEANDISKAEMKDTIDILWSE